MLHVPVGLVVPLSPTWYFTEVELTVTDVPSLPFAPFVPALATANENFLFIVTPSTTTGILASQAVVIVAVVVNVILP